MAIYLKISQIDGKEKELELTDELIIGRSKSCSFQVSDPQVSGKHCSIFIQENQVTIKDLGSTNGCFVNESKVLNARLYINDDFRIGSTLIKVNPLKMSGDEKKQHTRSQPKTQVTFISLNDTESTEIRKLQKKRQEKIDQRRRETNREKLKEAILTEPKKKSEPVKAPKKQETKKTNYLDKIKSFFNSSK